MGELIAMQSECFPCRTHDGFFETRANGAWHPCPQCERDRRQSQIDARIRAAGIPARYESARMENCEASEACGDWLRAAAAGDPGALLIVGPVGTGKTYLAAALVRSAAERGVETTYRSVADYLRDCRETWSARDRSESQVFKPLASVRLLVLDELGAGVNVQNDDWRLHELISARYDRALPTVFVSNLKAGSGGGPEFLRNAIGDRAYDRMRDGGVLVKLSGASRRRGKSDAA